MYQVLLLIEQALSHADARRVTELAAPAGEPRHYYVLLPVENAAARVEAAIGTLSASEVMATSSLAYREVDVEQIQQEVVEQGRADLATSLAALAARGVSAAGEITSGDPVAALVAATRDRSAAEVVVLTRPHVVAELCRLDWTSKARRRLSVPVVHLLERAADDAAERPTAAPPAR